jgi:phosphoserine phosphatase RsbU/P
MPHILIIDDDPTAQLVLKRALQGQGYEVTVAVNGQEGLHLARQIHPALIVCDWMMPLMSGLEVCQQIKADPNLCTTFFILLTARGSLEDRIIGLDTGADDFLTRPIEISELQARVRAGLRLHQLTQDLKSQKQVLESELSEAAVYMRSLLPPPLEGKITIDSRFIPCQRLGGDCFDYYWLDPDYLAVYLLDVSGHGLGAALLSVAVLNLLRSQSLPDVNFYQPQDVLRALNETFPMNHQNQKYFTIWYGVYNQAKRVLTYASAGHPPAILVSHASGSPTAIRRFRTPTLPIGMVADTKFTSYRYTIPSQSCLYIFSDGVYDLPQIGEDHWGLDPFINLLEKQDATADLDGILDYIQMQTQVDTFPDDLSLLRVNFDSTAKSRADRSS